ncbi:MAG: UDP-N-acetylmuramoyl-L-alanyl-D-glutamate--2,6-diaminopimelate ligase [Sediminibacterium sp.]|jgi:UDP-N-acetylmuramoyl-L-alanyl-D-glutamate--2,6-diaminopimelate ligase|nr:UDP-N-acetylmuramoyl-L-alanyl-D-glutamate--2,6-diaminopimelate ligase [Chitinophagaceae bacterium]MCA6448440.1 UDP-N-acetylmuramoyl-L-alanyl-D-glutamate--2,6-diaminopimelate ligase [Chitinophagaceae bacterium]
MQLHQLIQSISPKQVLGETHVMIEAIDIDSRKAKKGSLFVAIKGVQADGHAFIEKAIEQGAVAVLCEIIPTQIKEGVAYIQVTNAQEAVAYLAKVFYGNPSAHIKLVGVTGTNGKTTIATLLFKLFRSLGYRCGLISTVQNQIDDEIVPATHTTPDVISLNALLKRMVEAGCSHVFMECSSHAIHQHRITGLDFTGALFSNITHDHLDYHKTFDEYIRVKKSFFDQLSANAFAISNADDKRGEVMLQNTIAKKYLYSLKTLASFKGKILENVLTGLVMLVNDKEVHFRLIGEFNAYNLLAVYGAAICLGEDSDTVLQALSMITGAEGRFDYIINAQKMIGIVDYAHTPDALENVLTTIKKLRKGHEQIITVVGCGGDRDKTKRPIMAQAACDLSDRVILTSDNPRTEDPAQILVDMEKGLSSAAKRKYITVIDRREAIKTAVDMAKAEDIILVAGKGHEKYQDIKGVKYPFDDKAVLQEFLNQPKP